MKGNRGVYIALLIMSLWSISLAFLLMSYSVSFLSPLTYFFILLQSHLYTGIFITAHDAMHSVVSSNKKVNTWIGRICATIFAFNFYDNLLKKHYEHHRFVGTDKDPDYHGGGFWIWYLSFAKQYINLWQILLMAITYNALKLLFPTENVILFWMLPSIISTFQLFYFGTYLPHKGEHAPENIHKSNSQRQNHLWAFLTCYFFGYHYEHHNSPRTPWWMLPQEKEKGILKNII
ncbi:MAG: fatty acid desaturase [Cytophagales bacterium]|nr:MAG: fatty acid desaturase [Cytophagales bacterium]